MAADAPPPCAKRCSELKEQGELRATVTVEACTIRLCQEEGRALYRRGAFEEALAALDHIRERRVGSPAYDLDRGLVLYGLGRFDEAVEAFDKVLEVFPTSVRAATQRAHALTRLDRLDDAQEQFEKLLELDGIAQEYKGLRTSSYLLGNIGVLKLRRGKLKDGKSDLERSLDADGSNSLAATMLYKVVPALEADALGPEAIGLLANSYEELALGRRDEAVAGFEQVVKRWPRFEVGWRVLGDFYFAGLDYATCEEVYRRAERSLPDVTDLRLDRIRCTILRHGVTAPESRAALKELQEIAEQEPDNPRVKEMRLALDL
jgi:tetratricopeptide (TPR) repeat protein